MGKIEKSGEGLNIWPSFADISICAMVFFLIFSLYLISLLPNQIQIGELSSKQKVNFPQGKAELPEAAYNKLDTMYNSIIYGEHRKEWKDQKYIIVVEGHTDNTPIHNSKYRSNWELSAARALSVVDYFVTIKQIDPKRIRAIGYGEYHPKQKNDSDSHKEENRRIEIKLVKANGQI